LPCLPRVPINATMLAFPIGDHRILRRHLSLLVAVLVLALTSALCAQETDSPTDKAFADARKRYDEGRFADALTVIQLYESENKFSTTLPKAIYFEACCHIGLHKYQEAADTFNRLIRTYPTSPLIPQAILKEAECRRAVKSYPRATVLYQQFETQYPQHEMLPQAMLGEAQTLFQQNDLKAAKSTAETICAKFPNEAKVCLDSQFLLGQILTEERDYDAAEKVYQQIATNNNPSVPAALFLQAETRFASGQFQAARDDFTVFLQRYAESKLAPGALFRLGRCDFALSQKETNPKAAQADLADAVNNYELIRKKFPSSELLREVTFQLGYLHAYLDIGDTVKSLVSFQEFVQRWPKDPLVPEALYQIAHNEFAQSKFDAAIAAYKHLIDKYPHHDLVPFAVRELAAAYRTVGNDMRRQGHFPQAQDAFENSPAFVGDVGTPGQGTGGVPPPGGMPKDYHAHILTPSADVIGVLNNEVTEITHPVGNLSDVSLAPLIGISETRIGGAGLTGPGGNIFGPRIGPQRTMNLAKFQGSAETEKAVIAALHWLKTNQQQDGSWKCGQSPPAGTALAMLAFLGHGETPDSTEFGQTVTKGLLYLAQHIDNNGLVSGVSQDYVGYGYSQGPVVLALSEGYAMTQSPVLREPLDRALQAVFRQQAAAKTRSQDIGGWRNQSSANDSDVSVTGWMVMALKSAQAAGLEIPQSVFDKATQYLWNMYDTKDPGFGYQNPERYPTMTAIGILCQQFLGNGKDPRIKGALDYLREQKVDWDKADGDFVLYGWYYMTQAMFQGGGSYWQYWNNEIRETMIRNQQKDGRWMPPPKSNIEIRELARTPAYSTALGALILEVYYRYPPINQLIDSSGPEATHN
jgi:TolA-binding protein